MNNQLRSIQRNLRRFSKANSTILHWLGIKRAKAFGFYIPYAYAEGNRALGANETFDWLLSDFLKRIPEFREQLVGLSKYNSIFMNFLTESHEDKNAPRFNNDWFSGLDAAVAYGIVREARPARILEIGSGHSTRWMARAIRDGQLSTKLFSIDPEPRREIDNLCHGVIRTTLQQSSREIFQELNSGDILFFDGSHVLMPGTDCDIVFGEIMPKLKAGVIVHIHDIFLPFGYPAAWQRRNYNEQNALLAMIGGARYEVLLPNYFMRHFAPEICEQVHAPKWKTAYESSIWLKVRE